MFAPGSRYERVPQAVWLERGGRRVPYVLLRTFPPVAPAQQGVVLQDGDRLDLVSFRFYGDPEQFWRICDANRTLRPEDVEVAGRRLSIPLAVR
jgi:hypothetical protein